MKTPLRALVAVGLLSALQAVAQQRPSPSKTIPDSINYMWKMVEKDFTALAEAMPEENWSFKPTQGAFTNVRTFGRFPLGPANTRSGFIGTIHVKSRGAQASRMHFASKAVSPSTTTSTPSGTTKAVINSAASSVCLR